MRKNIHEHCLSCEGYKIIDVLPGGEVRASVQRSVLMTPTYISVKINGKRTWKRIGLYCPKCQRFHDYYFEPRKHAA